MYFYIDSVNYMIIDVNNWLWLKYIELGDSIIWKKLHLSNYTDHSIQAKIMRQKKDTSIIMDKQYYSFKKLFWSYTFCSIPFLLLAGLLALFKIAPVYFNEAPVYGLKGFIVSIVFIPFTGIILSSCNWLALNFGFMLYNSFQKMSKGKKTDINREGQNWLSLLIKILSKPIWPAGFFKFLINFVIELLAKKCILYLYINMGATIPNPWNQ